jgi:hypothetical protein
MRFVQNTCKTVEKLTRRLFTAAMPRRQCFNHWRRGGKGGKRGRTSLMYRNRVLISRATLTSLMQSVRVAQIK